MRLSIIVILSTLILYACVPQNGKKEDQKAGVKDVYEISIPHYFSPSPSESNDTIKAFQNTVRDIHASILYMKKEDLSFDENDSTDFEITFQTFLLLIFMAEDDEMKFDDEQDENYKELKINGLNAKQASITGDIEGTGFNLILTLISGKTKYYQIISMSALNKKEKYKEDFERMILSFKELENNIL